MWLAVIITVKPVVPVDDTGIFCTNCNSPLSDEWESCPRCGGNAGQVTDRPSDSTGTPDSYKSESNVLLLAIIPGVLGIIGLGYHYWQIHPDTAAFPFGILGIIGLGHLYLGKMSRGIVLLILGLPLSAIAWVAVWIMIGFIASVVYDDAYWGRGGWFEMTAPSSLIPLALYVMLLVWSALDARRLCWKYNSRRQWHEKQP